MSHRVLVLLAPVGLLGCRSPERTFDMQWELTSRGGCNAPGNERFAGEQEITLRYTRTPKYFEVFCSNKLATAIKASSKTIVPMVARRDSAELYSICEVAGLKVNAPGTVCTFAGHISGGRDCVATRDGDCSKDTVKPTPWD